VDLVILVINKDDMKQKVLQRVYLLLALILLVQEVSILSQEQNVPVESNEDIKSQEFYFVFTEATKLYLFGNYSQAVNLYKECLKIKPNSATIYYQLAKIFMNSGATSLARENAKIACKLSGDNKWYMQELADIYQVEQKYDSAIVVYQALLNLDKENVSVIYSIAELYERLNKFKESLLYLDIIDKKIGFSKEVSLIRYRIFERRNENQLALEQLKKAYELSYHDYSVTGMMAEFFRDHGKPDSASKYYAKIYPTYKSEPIVVFSFAEFLLENAKFDSARAILIDVFKDQSIDNAIKYGYFYKIIQEERSFKLAKPILDSIVSVYYKSYFDEITSMSVYADIEVRLGNCEKALIALRRIVSRDVSNYPAFEQIILCYNALGKTDSVFYFSNQAIANFGEKPVPYLFYGLTKFQKGEYQEASIVFEKGLLLTDNNALKLEFYSILADCYQKNNQFEKSVATFGLALKIDDTNLMIKNNYAYYLSLRNENLKLAREMSLYTVKREPNNSVYLDTYAWVLFKMNKLNAAKKYIVRAIGNNGGNDKDILTHYGEILVSLKDYDQALIYFKKAMEVGSDDEINDLKKRIEEVELIRRDY
jgi:tetratricopeptide (TPR) repeat protein